MPEQNKKAPAFQLKTKRGLIKFILFSIITLGIYPIIAYSSISSDINVIATKYDGKKTMHFCLLLFIMMPLTIGIAGIVWFHRISKRIGNELRRRNQNYSFGAGSYWGWFVLGSIIVVGPFVYLHKLLKSMNLISQDFNSKG